MHKKKNHRRSYSGHMLLLSLGVVLSVLTVGVVVVSFIFNQAVVATVRDDNEKLLQLTQKIEDNIFRDVFSNAVQLSADAYLQRWLRETEITSYGELNNVKNRVTQISNACSYIDSIYVTFPALNLAVTNFGFFFRYDKMPDESWKSFAEQLSENRKLSGWMGRHDILHEKYGKTREVISLILRLPFDGTNKTYGWIVINISGQYIEEYLAQNVGDYTRIVIWDQEGGIICSSFTEEQEKELLPPMDFPSAKEQQIQGCHYLLETSPSGAVEEWTYAAYTDTNSLNNAHRSIYVSIFFAMVAVAALAITATYWGSKRMYHPIASLASITENMDAKAIEKINSFNDLQTIFDRYSRALRENNDTHEMIERNRSMLQERFLVSLLLGYVQKNANNREYMSLLGLGSSVGKQYALGLIHVEQQEQRANQIEIESIRQIVISDFMQEAARSESTVCYTAELASGTLATILEIEKKVSGEKTAFMLYNKLYTFMKEQLHTRCAICVSTCVDDWLQLPSAYRQVRDVMKFATDYNKYDLIMCSNSAIQTKNTIDLPTYAVNLTQAVRGCQNDNILHIISQLRLEVEKAQILREGSAVILSSIFNVVAISLSGESEEELMQMKTLSFKPEDTVEEMFHQLLSGCLEFSNKRARQREMNLEEISKKMLCYLEENYMKDISLADMADTFLYTATYINRVLKLTTQKTFYELLTEIRLQKACEYLRNDQLQVSQISEKVGYTNVQSFIRMFKKNVGCTPGQYRQEQQPDVNALGILSKKEI